MKKIVTILLMLFVGTVLFAQLNLEEEARNADTYKSTESVDDENYNALSYYKPNYIIFGNKDDQVKAQISLKYEFFKDWGIYVGYSQVMFWDLYDASSPFKEINFNPEFFWKYKAESGALDFFKIGAYEHKSTGMSGIESKGWDRSYLEFQLSAGERVNAGIGVKGFYIYNIKDNEDIVDYLGYFEAKVFFKLSGTGSDSYLDKEEIYFKFGMGKNNYGFDAEKGWYEAGIKLKALFPVIQPYLYAQFFYGHGESMVNYDQKDWALRFGLILQ